MSKAKIDEAVRRIMREEHEPTSRQLRQHCLMLALQSVRGSAREIITAAETYFLFLTAGASADKPTVH